MVSTECVGVGLVQVKFYLWVFTDHTAGYHLSGFTKLLNMQTNVINFTLRMLSKNVDRYSLSFLGKQSSIFKSLVTWMYHKVASKITRQCLKFPLSHLIKWAETNKKLLSFVAFFGIICDKTSLWSTKRWSVYLRDHLGNNPTHRREERACVCAFFFFVAYCFIRPSWSIRLSRTRTVCCVRSLLPSWKTRAKRLHNVHDAEIKD